MKLYEVIEAVEEYYKNDEDMIAYCLSYLRKFSNENDEFMLAEELRRMGRCPLCGGKLKEFTYKEYHSEIEGDNKFEIMHDVYCPECGI